MPACGTLLPEDEATIAEFKDVKDKVEYLLDHFRFRDAQKEAMNLARIGNKYLTDAEPWKVINTDPERVKTILYIALQLVANLATAFAPFLPFSSERLRRMLKLQTLDWSRLGQTDLLPAGHQIDQAELLFEKIEDEVVTAQVEKLKAMEAANEAAEKKAEPISAETTIDEFAKMDLRVGTVLSCERVPKSDKLLQFKIDDGLGGRTIVSGIAKFYEAEQLVGKQVVFIANLPPRKLRGIVSEGMILSAQNLDGSLSVLSIDDPVAPGSQVG